MESKRLDSAAQAAGISLSYINAHGKPQSIGADTKRRLLDAMHKTDAKASGAPVPNVKVFTAGKKTPLKGAASSAGCSPPKRGISIKAMPPAAKPSPFRRSCRRAITA